jgi:predicted O-methyltransferase YrrM
MPPNVATTWSAGYITEVDYTIGFYRELAPSFLNWAAVQRGYRAPEIDQPFTVLELGCGHGYSANVLAACNPEGRFFATDFNPAHVISARRLAAEAGAGNVTFFEDSFSELKNRELPEFDYINLHGVYSWISPENRREIVDLIARKLKPGGLVYVSYNALPGWAAMAPARRLMTQYAATFSAPLTEKFDKALALLQQLKDAGAHYFSANPAVAPRLDKVRDQNRNYLLHEYFNDAWELLYHADVAAEMEGAKLNFIASASYAENLDRLAFPGQTHAVYQSLGDPVLKETVRDFATNQQFRRDVFTRGRIRLSHRELQAYYETTPFALIRARGACELKGQFPVGEVTLKPEAYQPLLDALAGGPKTLPELLRQPPLAQQNFASLIESLHVLGALGYAQAGRPLSCKARNAAASRAFNQAVLQRTLMGQELSTLASPVLGCGVTLGLTDQLFLCGYQRQPKDPIAFVWQQLKALGRRLLRDGQTLDGEADSLQRLRELHEMFVADTLPLCRQLALL